MWEYKWFTERFCQLRVPFPAFHNGSFFDFTEKNAFGADGSWLLPSSLISQKLITNNNNSDFCGFLELLKDSSYVSGCLKKAHAFLSSIGNCMQKDASNKAVDDTLEKLNFIWTVFALSDILYENGGYHILFDKRKLRSVRNIKNSPSDFLFSFSYLKKRGIDTVFLKNGQPIEKPSFTFCDGGKIYFGSELTTGLYLFVKKCLSFPFYGGPERKLLSERMCYYSSPYYRCDFRVMKETSYIDLSFNECLTGLNMKYSEWGMRLDRLREFNSFKIKNSIFAYICSSSTFYSDKKKPVFSVEVTPSKKIRFRTSVNKREMCRIYKKIDLFDSELAKELLHSKECSCSMCLGVKNHITYRNKKYNAPYERMSFDFYLENTSAMNNAYNIVESKLV